MKKTILATIFLLGLGYSLPVRSTIYTHNLIYTAKIGDNTATLTGQVSFQDADDSAQSDFSGALGGAAAIDRDLITAISFTYTPAGGDAVTISGNDITGFIIDHTNNGSTDYSSSSTLFSQLTNLQFYSTGQAFELAINNDNFEVQAGTDDDFTLTSTTYHSPGPLPLFGLFTAFSSIRKLKSKYKRKYNL